MRNLKEKFIRAAILFRVNPFYLFKTLYFKVQPAPKCAVKKRINGVIFELDFDYDPMIKDMYYGIYEILTVHAMKRFLKRGDSFIDVGANIGYLSAIAMGLVGKKGQVHSFEPVPGHYEKLRNVAQANPGYNITVNQCALGETPGKAKISITNLANIGWNTMVPGFMRKETVKETEEVSVITLSDYIADNKLENIALIKIDTEGFEFPVLLGLGEYFEKSKNLPAIVCEIQPNAYPLLGCQLSQLSEYMKRFNYNAFELNNPSRRVDITKLAKLTNVLFIRDQR